MIELAVPLASACSGSNPFQSSALGPPLPVIVRDSTNAYQAAPSVQIRLYAEQIDPGQRPGGGAALGRRGPLRSRNYNRTPLSVVGADGKASTRTPLLAGPGRPGPPHRPQYGAGWRWSPSRDPAASAITAAADLGGLLDQFQRHAGALVSEGTSGGGARRSSRCATVRPSTTCPRHPPAARGRRAAPRPDRRAERPQPGAQVRRPARGDAPRLRPVRRPGDAATFPALLRGAVDDGHPVLRPELVRVHRDVDQHHRQRARSGDGDARALPGRAADPAPRLVLRAGGAGGHGPGRRT